MNSNFSLIKPLLVFDSEDDFYFLQILKRKKENPELGRNSSTIKTYYINSTLYFEEKKEEIIELCNNHNARAYINLNPRSYEKCALHTLKKVTDIILNKSYKDVIRAYDSVCGKFSSGKRKSWVVDIDWVDLKDKTEASLIYTLIEELQRETKIENPILNVVPTKNGFHLITSPFNLQKFKVAYPKIQVHKNSPTLLFCP